MQSRPIGSGRNRTDEACYRERVHDLDSNGSGQKRRHGVGYLLLLVILVAYVAYACYLSNTVPFVNEHLDPPVFTPPTGLYPPTINEQCQAQPETIVSPR